MAQNDTHVAHFDYSNVGGGKLLVEKTFSGQNLCSCAFGANISSYTKTKGPTRNPFSPTPPPLLRRASMSPPPPRRAILRSPWTPGAAQRHRSGSKRCGDAHREGGAVGCGGALCGRAPAVWVVDRHRPQSRLVGAGPPRGRGRNECTTDSDSIVRSSCPARTRHRPEPCTEVDGVHAKGSPGSPCTTGHQMGGNGGNGEGKFCAPVQRGRRKTRRRLFLIVHRRCGFGGSGRGGGAGCIGRGPCLRPATVPGSCNLLPFWVFFGLKTSP